MLFALFLLVPTHGWAAAFGSVSGTVQDAQAKPVSGAHVTLQSTASGAVQTVRTNKYGRFNFPNVPLGTYQLFVAAEGFGGSTQPVTVESGYFPLPRILLQRRGELAQVTVSAAAERSPPVASMTPITLVSQVDIERTPGAGNVNSLAMITDYVPGAYEAHDMLHIRGGHQTSWLIDGVAIPNTNIAENLGPQINPQDIQTLGAERGSYQADEGDRTYGIFNVIPKTGFGGENQAELAVTAGNFGQTDDYVSAASHTDNFAYYASLEGNRSDLGLQTPVSQVIHDRTRGYGVFSNLQYEPSPQDAVSLVAQVRQDDYQIPDCTAPLANAPNCVGQLADEQGEADNFALLTWAHTFTNDAVLTSSLMYHFARAAYDGGAGDHPIVTTFHHGSQYEGAEENLRMGVSRNHLDAGVYGFAQQDDVDFNLTTTDGSSPPITQLESPTGSLLAAWVADTFTVTHWLNLSAGVRQTHFQGVVTENATDPRYGATVTLPRLGWVLSAFWGKYYQAPPLETLSGSFAAYATAQGTEFLPLRGERDKERQFGLTIPLMGWTVETDFFVTQARNFFDHNPIGESDIYLPITEQGALIEGRELTVRSPSLWRFGQVHLAYSNQTAECFGAITGGLVVAGTECGGSYVGLDHDQRNTLALGYQADLPERFFLGGNLAVNSGLTNGGSPPSHLPSYTVLDLTVGRNISPDLQVSLTGLNVSNRHLLTDNSLTFGGVHWNDPFQIYAELRYRFPY
ncbi:MAG TPA: TonB-dependent receptor [Steroidobacteraceae bacterium]|nr:TonB-dependent receptor [Steroidobacteraceae bacterium]